MEIIATRKDFIDQYVGWSYSKTTEFLKQNINNKIIVDESEGPLYSGENDSFGKEVIMAFQNFGGNVEFLNGDKDKLSYYFNITMNLVNS